MNHRQKYIYLGGQKTSEFRGKSQAAGASESSEPHGKSVNFATWINALIYVAKLNLAWWTKQYIAGGGTEVPGPPVKRLALSVEIFAKFSSFLLTISYKFGRVCRA